MKYKVGDKVRIVDNMTGHGFEIGDVVVIEEVNIADNDYKTTKDGDDWFVIDSEVEPVKAKPQLEVGKTYTAKNGHEYTCISVTDTHAWLILCNTTGTAYVWNIDGKAKLGHEWDIDLGPNVKTITVKGSIDTKSSGGWITYHSNMGDHKFNMEVTTLDGVPDWTTAKVTPCD